MEVERIISTVSWELYLRDMALPPLFIKPTVGLIINEDYLFVKRFFE